MTVPQDGLFVNDSSISPIDNTRTPGDEIMFICRPGFVPQTTRRAVCQENGTWSPDPKELLCLVGEYNNIYIYTVEPLYKDTSEMRTSSLIRTPCMVPVT